MMMLVITHTLTANGTCPDEQQAALLSGYRNHEFNQDLRREFSYVPCFRLAHLWPLTMITLRSPAQYQGQQRSPWTRSTGKRVQNEPNDRQSELVGKSKISWGTPTNSKKRIRAGIVFRAAGGGRADRRPPIEDTNLIFTSCRHQQSIKTIW